MSVLDGCGLFNLCCSIAMDQIKVDDVDMDISGNVLAFLQDKFVQSFWLVVFTAPCC